MARHDAELIFTKLLEDTEKFRKSGPHYVTATHRKRATMAKKFLQFRPHGVTDKNVERPKRILFQFLALAQHMVSETTFLTIVALLPEKRLCRLICKIKDAETSLQTPYTDQLTINIGSHNDDFSVNGQCSVLGTQKKSSRLTSSVLRNETLPQPSQSSTPYGNISSPENH